MVPRLENPQSLNRYSYTYNNPLKYTDPTGHNPWWILLLEGLNLYGIVCDAQVFGQNPTLTNFAWLSLDVVDPTPMAWGAGKKAFLRAVNDWSFVSHAGNYEKSGVWLKNNFERGKELEKRLGGMCNNYPTIDGFIKVEGTDFASSITSIKSMDITSPAYNQGNRLLSQLEDYLNELEKFTGATYKGEDLFINRDTTRRLELVFPPTALTVKQEDQLSYALDLADSLNIEVNISFLE